VVPIDSGADLGKPREIRKRDKAAAGVPNKPAIVVVAKVIRSRRQGSRLFRHRHSDRVVYGIPGSESNSFG
jgi:hypothetical protein